MHDIKYTTLDELHENDPGLTIGVLKGSVKEGLASIKLHILHLFTSHLKFPCNVDFAVNQNAFKVRSLPVCSDSAEIMMQ